jgi:hypothetical protein
MKMKLIIILFTLSTNIYFSQELIDYGGLFIETPDFKDTSSHRYTKDNKIYKFNKKFEFDYYYKDPHGPKSKFLIQFDTINNPMSLIDYQDSSLLKINKFRIFITDKLKHYSYNDSAYSWTVFNYEYLDNKGNNLNIEEYSSLVENNKNLFLVPPRHKIFDILFINPFPFVYTNANDRKWEWYLTIQPTEMYKKWLKFDEEFTIEHVYYKKGKGKIETNFGVLNCDKIVGIGNGKVKNKKIKTKSVFYYHETYGFVRIENKLWNNSDFVIELINTNE